jgi:two-component system sensor histidine kinase KdpD
MTDSDEALSILARAVARRFDLEYVALALPGPRDWVLIEGGHHLPLDRTALTQVFAAAQRTLEFDAQARTYAGQATIVAGERPVRLVPLRAATRPIGLLAAAGRSLEPGTLDALAGVVAIAVDRATFLEERKAAELTRRSEALKSALLASLGHDLRTPLTAIRVGASNLQASWLTEDDRREQSDVILTEVERLTRLFENILEMARIDAGAVTADAQWVHHSEIVTAARNQVDRAIRHHEIDVEIDPDTPVRLDPRLTATALAHVLENAAHYSPAGSRIGIRASATADGLVVHVRDRGPGIAPADLPRLFDRFYRGTTSGGRPAGTGMGLSIARGLLAAERGRIWAENCEDGGARFTIAVEPVAEPLEAAPGRP